MIRKSTTLAVALALALVAGCSRESSADLVASGKTLLEKKDTKGAVIQFKNALQKDANNGAARFFLGKALLEGGEPASALVELRKALELQVPDEQVMPELARAMLLAGEEGKLLAQYGELTLKDPAAGADFKTSLAAAHALQRETDKARAAAEEALKLRPGYAPATIVLVRLKALEGDIDGAIAMADSVIAADPANDRAGVVKGELLLAGKRDAEGALAAFRQVLKVNPNSVPARVAATNILFQLKRNEDARAEFELLKKQAPRHPETLFFEAQLAFADKDFKRTRELTDLILRAMPDNVRVLELAGAAAFRTNSFVQAETFLAKALKLAPKQLLTRHMLAQTYLRSGQAAKALEALQPALDGTPEATTLSLAGEAHLQLGDAKRSEEAFQRALKIAPQDNRVRTSAAMAQMARGNTAAAAAELEAVAAGDSGPRADLALVSARLRQNDTAGALKAIDGLEKKMPDQALPLQLRGRVLAMRKDTAGARRAYEAALAKDPTYFAAVASLAALDIADRKLDAARQRFDAHLKAYPKSWQAKLALAELDVRSGAAPAAVLATLREAVKLNPAEPKPQLVLINHLLGSDDARGALQAAQDAIAAQPDNLELLDAKGRAELAAGDNQGAVTTFKKLASLQPRSALPEMRLADAYVATKDIAAATRSLRRAAELQPGLVAPQRALAQLALQDKRPQDALTIAREMQKAHPTDPAGFALEGEIESVGNRNEEAAVAAFRAAAQRAPTSSELQIKLHSALVRARKAPEADRLATDWLKGHPQDAGFLYYLGDQALAQNSLARAEARYRAVLELLPDHALAMNNVAWLMSKQGKPGALALAEKANQLMPNRAPLLDTLASVLEADNQLPKAIEAQKRAIAAAPKDPVLNLRLAKLYIKSGDKAGARAELDALSRLGDRFNGQAEVASLLKSL